MKATVPGTDRDSMGYEDEVDAKGCGIWGTPASESFKSRGPRPTPRRQGMGRALRLIAVVLMILIPLALWVSSAVATSATTALTHY
jgi:hypothetical protein